MEYLTVCTVFDDADDEKLDEFINAVTTVSKPDVLNNQDVYIEDGDYEDYEVTYSNGVPETPNHRVSRSVIQSNIFEEEIEGEVENKYHVHSYITPDLKDEILTLQAQLLAPCEEARLSFITAEFTFEDSMDEMLQSAGSQSDGLEVKGLEFEKEGYNITLSDYPVGPSLTCTDSESKEIAPSSLTETVDNHIESSKTVLEEVF